MLINEDKDVLIIEQPCWSVARFHREQIKSVVFQVYGDPLGFSVLSCLSIRTWQGQSVTIIPDDSEILKTVKNLFDNYGDTIDELQKYYMKVIANSINIKEE